MNNPFEIIETRLNNIETLLLEIKHNPIQEDHLPNHDRWLDLTELMAYDPEKRTRATFYGYINQKIIPYHKRGRKLTFLKSEIDEWLKSGRHKTINELSKEADDYLSSKKRK